MASNLGKLYVVATPIGNLDDMSKRALETLGSVNRILAEDTRRTQQLLSHYGISNRLVSFHDHNEIDRIEQVFTWLSSGESLALVSDAGTPLISDPGYRLIRHLRQHMVAIVVVPGPSAITAALSICGLATDRFVFEGFLPAKSVARRKHFVKLAERSATTVFYESSHRIVASLHDLLATVGADREIALLRELTKRFETVLFGGLSEVIEIVEKDINQQKGEFVLVVGGVEQSDKDDLSFSLTAENLLELLLKTYSTKDATQIVSDLSGISRKKIYPIALKLQQS